MAKILNVTESGHRGKIAGKITPEVNVISMKKILSGLGVSPGTARGKVRVVEGVQDEKKFRDGEILVTRITDPTMVVMMNRASAIVCDIGGMTSHPSIIARELGIPCVVNAKEATKILHDGEEVMVNGATGEVFLAG